jgi:hypothetical protein
MADENDSILTGIACHPQNERILNVMAVKLCGLAKFDGVEFCKTSLPL